MDDKQSFVERKIKNKDATKDTAKISKITSEVAKDAAIKEIAATPAHDIAAEKDMTVTEHEILSPPVPVVTEEPKDPEWFKVEPLVTENDFNSDCTGDFMAAHLKEQEDLSLKNQAELL